MGGCATRRSAVEIYPIHRRISIISNESKNEKMSIDTKNIVELFDQLTGDIKNFRIRLNENHIQINELIHMDLLNHKLIFLLKETLLNILIKWTSFSLTDDEMNLFRNISMFFFEISQCFNRHTPMNVYQSFLSTMPFIDLLNECLIKMLLNGKHFDDKHNLKSFTYLLNTFRNFQTNSSHSIDEIPSLFPLILSVNNLLRSNYYFETFLHLSSDISELTEFEDFILDKCSMFIISYKGKSSTEVHDDLLEQTFDQYIQIFEHFLPHIQSWSTSFILIFTHMVDIMINASTTTQTHIFQQPKLIDYALVIVSNDQLCSNLDSFTLTPQICLMNSILTGLHNMIYEPKLLAMLKRKTMTKIFLKIANTASYDRIQIHSYLILAGILSEDEIQKLNNAKEITKIFYKYLRKAIKSEEKTFKGVTVMAILSGLKTLVQHEEIKEAIRNEDQELQLLSEMVFTSNEQELTEVLSILWTLSFNENVALIIRKNQRLINQIRMLATRSNSESIKMNNIICSAAEGILWQVEDEVTLLECKKEVQDDQLHHSSIPELSLRKKKYDIMISYSHDDKQICHRIADSLVNDGFLVWIDKNNITGSTAVAIADGIENSEIVLIGMTFSYKISPWCQRESNYAFQRQAKIIPLKLPPSYTPDGWLGLLLTNLKYINFVKLDFDIAYEQLKREIESCKQQINVSHVNAPNVTVIQAMIDSKQGEYVYPPESNGLYKAIPMENWTSENVKDFLNDKKLYPFNLLCKDMNGSALIQLYKLSNENSTLAFESLQKQLSNQFNHHHLSPIDYSRFIGEIKSFNAPSTQSHLCVVM
ncbi:unnamed protein product [Adineta ricciae]|uniref:TIR domain-containing protein n=1 Tax=Adineta ricciae TaxID=249248 RepID=A0A813TC06_ADIRI|nr:unnamed protein product [Adineta ricciae]CAF1380019.1 unnamed protein product [Adineta ricciae]